jgi:ubiquinone/menaquinone biosynthesis C-methylase UbiE
VTSVLARYQRIAPLYDLLDAPFEHGRYRQIRPVLWRGLHGRLLDAGVGTGRNFSSYPAGAEVIGVDLSPAMLMRAERRRAALGGRVVLRRMDVTALEFADENFDAVVATFLFCVLPPQQQRPALLELMRVIRPGGELRLLEYVRPHDPGRRLVARLWAPWMQWAYGAGHDRDTEAHVAALGLTVQERRYLVPDLVLMLRLGRPR